MLALVDVLQRTERFLRERGVTSPRLDAELLLGHVLSLDRVSLYLRFDQPLDEAELERLRPLVRRRGNREPMAYILGSRGFHDIELATPRGVLIPRPDTESLVEHALAALPVDQPFFVADACAGTGAVGLAIAAARPLVKVFATDLSPEAIGAVKENARRLGLEGRVAALRGSLLDPIPRDRVIDLVVANPPYIPSADLDGLAPEIRDHEPRLALDGGPDGLDLYRALIPAAAARARRAVLVEIGADQGAAVASLMQQAGLVAVAVHRDLGGRDRVVAGRNARES